MSRRYMYKVPYSTISRPTFSRGKKMKKWEKEGSSRRKGRKNNKKGRKQRILFSLVGKFFRIGHVLEGF